MKFDAESHWNKSHEGHPQNRPSSKYGIEKEKLYPRNSIICDLGGGDGTDSLHFLRKGHTVFLYDISKSALKMAIQKAGREGLESKLKTFQMDLAKGKIPIQENIFDVLYSRLSLHYFYQDKTIEILKEVHRVLKDSGIAYIAVKSPKDIKEMQFLRNNSREIDKGVFVDNEGMTKSRFTKEQYKEMLKKADIANFEINEYTEHFGKQRIYIKSKADYLQYLELVIRKS